jgi:hypothetical protein
MGRSLTGTFLDLYQFETCRPLNPVEEVRLREALEETERLAWLHAVDRRRFFIVDAWITGIPPAGSSYLSTASALRTSFPPARVRAKKRRTWWLPWRRGGGRG